MKNHLYFIIPAEAGIYRKIDDIEVKVNILRRNQKNATLNGVVFFF